MKTAEQPAPWKPYSAAGVPQAFFISEHTLHEDFLQQRAKLRQLFHQGLGLDLEFRLAGIQDIDPCIGAEIRGYAAGVDIEQISEFHIAMLFRIDSTEEIAEKIGIGQQALRYRLRIEQELDIGNAMCLHIRIKNLRPRKLALLQDDPVGLFADIRQLYQRNRLQGLRRFLALLALFEARRGCDDVFNLGR